MAYNVFPVTSLTDIPALVRDFADQLGYTTSGSTGATTVKHPTYAGAKTFTVDTLMDGSGRSRRERVTLALDVPDMEIATAESPKLNPTGGATAGDVVVVQPTALHLFGELHGDAGDAGGSFIAGVIEYGFNLYRHFYMGYVEKITPYGGGEVITGSSLAHSNISNVAYPWTDLSSNNCKAPFSAVNNNNTANGGMHIDHPGVSQPWFTFNTGTSPGNTIEASVSAANGNRVVIGGYRDSINSGYVTAAQSPYAGAQILVPVNLYIGKREGSQQLFQPVGAPAGVRMVHMENLEPGAQINVGSSVWRVFPIFSKDADPVVRTHDISYSYRYPPNNTSHYVGMAYRVSE